MRDVGAAVLADVEGELDECARRLVRAGQGTAGWRGAAADSARALWNEQARHLRQAAAALAEAQHALRLYAEEADAARSRIARADQVLASTAALDELYLPTQAAQAAAARDERVRAKADLEDAARRLATRLAALEAAAGIPAAAPGPCAPPPPPPPAEGWARVAEIVFGSSETGLFDPVTCEPILLVEAGGGGAILRGLTKRQARTATRERLIDDAAQAVLSNKENDHAFKHADQLFGYKEISQAQRLEWARLLGAGLQSRKTFAYGTGRLSGVGHLHHQSGRYWVVVQDAVTGVVRTAFMPNCSQLAAILRTIRGR